MSPEEPLRNLQGSRVLLAGGAGFVGSQLARSLLEVGAEVVVYDNFSHGRRAHLDELGDGVRVVIGDVLDEWKLARAFREHRPEYVFHLVSDTYVPTAFDQPKRFVRVNVEGTLNVLMAAKMFDVGRVLYASTTEVYGEARTPTMSEEHPLAPLNTYAVTKLAADRLCFTFFHEHRVPVIIARVFNCYGPRATQPYVIPEIIAQLHCTSLEGRPRLSLGNLQARRDFTYVEDTARALIATMASDLPDGEAVNVGSNVSYSVRELANAIGETMGIGGFTTDVDPRRLRPLDIDSFRCDYRKLHEATGWKPEISLTEGLRRTVDWYRRHGARWAWESWVDGTTLYDASS